MVPTFSPKCGRTDLEGMSRSDLQALAMELGIITANLKNAVIIEKILRQRVAREHDIFREFKKEFDVLSREHLLALDRMARKATQALFALAPEDADEAVTMKRSPRAHRSAQCASATSWGWTHRNGRQAV